VRDDEWQPLMPRAARQSMQRAAADSSPRSGDDSARTGCGASATLGGDGLRPDGMAARLWTRTTALTASATPGLSADDGESPSFHVWTSAAVVTRRSALARAKRALFLDECRFRSGGRPPNTRRVDDPQHALTARLLMYRAAGSFVGGVGFYHGVQRGIDSSHMRPREATRPGR